MNNDSIKYDIYDESLLVHINKCYEELDNYKIEYSEQANRRKRKCVAVYFSSNAIFFPNDVKTFLSSVIEKDRYEFQKNKIKRADKHIFLRDVYKSWYLLGINSKLCSIAHLYEFLKRQIEGYEEVLFVGDSAGGYAAILLGSMLHVDIILSFSPQWNLLEENIEWKIRNKRNDVDFTQIKQYFDITSIGNYCGVFYFCPVLSRQDLIQLGYAEKATSINIIKVVSSQHGIVIPLESLSTVINMSNNKLQKISGGSGYTPICFLYRVSSHTKRMRLLFYMLRTFRFHSLYEILRSYCSIRGDDEHEIKEVIYQ